jgi:uncharacterized protein YacL
MIQAITRFVFVTGGLLGGFAVTGLVNWQSELGVPQYYVIFLFILLGGSIGYVFGGIIGRELTMQWQHAEQIVHETAPADLVLGTVGLVIGLLIALLASQPLRLVSPVWLSIAATALLMFVSAYLSMRVALLKRRDFAAVFPQLAAPELVGAQDRPLVLDTSTVIDGRFVEMYQLGFLPGDLRVPRFVLGELQTLADSADETRRARGRRGLDLLSALPEGVGVTVFETDYNDIAAVDEKLLRLATDSKSALVTVDYNLAQVARVHSIEVLNLNDAAGALRPNFLPGEVVRIKIVKPGKEAEQGVGYLDDGTMVVVQGGRAHVGAEKDVEVTSVLQTSAGRMVFARVNVERQAESASA